MGSFGSGGPGDEHGFTKEIGKATGATAAQKAVGLVAESSAEVIANDSTGNNIESISFSRSFVRYFDLVKMGAKDHGNPVKRGYMTFGAGQTGELSVTGVGSIQGSTASLSYLIEINGVKHILLIVVAAPGEEKDLVAVAPVTVFWDGESRLQVALQAEGKARGVARGAGSKVTALVLFSHTLAWGGISNVTDEFGAPVASFTAVGEDGLDWATPAAVPLPPAVWLLGGAVAALSRRYRRVPSLRVVGLAP